MPFAARRFRNAADTARVDTEVRKHDLYQRPRRPRWRWEEIEGILRLRARRHRGAIDGLIERRHRSLCGPPDVLLEFLLRQCGGLTGAVGKVLVDALVRQRGLFGNPHFSSAPANSLLCAALVEFARLA